MLVCIIITLTPCTLRSPEEHSPQLSANTTMNELVPSLFGLFAPDALIGWSMLDRPSGPIWGPIIIMNK